ncbi:hypothetical protein [Ligilactobacillus sp. 110_WCHN]|uniref:hypothetical protein n=1 Tax=Ligilactobacillus sp. 110_WCHN TaxID=3057125 RepID=UPI0026715B74|nr:hypothetical protein [Ligilactobacillus sp. 110_WCHN]MDO3392592.1 hypothetical protein [Ligilactobacillus sp. 110_WCHN]
MRNVLAILLDCLPLILLTTGIVIISVGVFMFNTILGLIVTGVMLVAVALMLAYRKGDDY